MPLLKNRFKKRIPYLGSAILSLLLTPYFAYAITFDQIVGNFLDIIFTLIGVLSVLALAAFFLGVVRYIFSAGNSEKRREGATFMIYATVALFVMISVWGIVALLQFTVFQGDVGGFDGVPQLQGGGGGGVNIELDSEGIEVSFP